MAVGRTPALQDPHWLDGRLYWLEQRPQEQGRTTLLRRTGPDAPPEELTPGPWNLRSRVHDYGGGPCALGHRSNGAAVAVFVHDGDRSLWRLDLDRAGAAPVRLGGLEAFGVAAGALGDGLIDAGRDRWIGVLEADGRDHLVALSLEGGGAERIHASADFCGYPALSDSGRHLAWVEWQQPAMPWERSQLWLGQLQASGSLSACRPVAGSNATSPRAISVFQPIWAGTDLVVANDHSGYWNLERLADADLFSAEQLSPEQPTDPWQCLLPMEADIGMPQWVAGMSTHTWDGTQLLASACREGSWQLGRVSSAGEWQPLAQPFTDLAGLCAERGRLACIASNPTTPSGLLELELTHGQWHHTPAAPCPLEPDAISVPEVLWFAGHGGQRTHAWYYPPAGGAHPRAPLLVKGHSGPTSMARTGLSLGIQYWTSRGWGVVDVNYGGSTGFGRAYRERLDGQWGVVDVADCAAAAEALVAAGKACAQRIAIEGGSAGGFTVLAALCFTEVFRAGASRYGVADLSALARDTHRFEARYLDGLVGPWPVAKDTYAARSPLQHADRIRCPVIFFQGLDDVVVPPEQTERMALALQANGIPVEVHLFPEEGHGFRTSATQIQVLEATEAFFRRHFQL